MKKSRLLKYGITFVIGAFMALLVINNYGFWEAKTAKEKALVLSNAFTIPGTVIFLIGVLVFVATLGAFDGLVYALRNVAAVFVPGLGLREHQNYYDYITNKPKERASGYGFLFVVGLVYLSLAIFFTCLYYYL